jgi:hypothetical protein
MAEYVKFSGAERLYGEKNILHSELEVLNFVKGIKEYKEVRKESLILRIALKNKLEELDEAMKMLDKLLPKDMPPGISLTKRMDEKMGRKNISLEQEIEVIRRRLAKLHE